MDTEGIDIQAVQETWEGQYVISNPKGYKWYQRPREGKRGGIEFYIHASLGNIVQIFEKIGLPNSIWINLCGDINTKVGKGNSVHEHVGMC